MWIDQALQRSLKICGGKDEKSILCLLTRHVHKFSRKLSGLGLKHPFHDSVTHRLSTKKTQHPLLALWARPAYLAVSGWGNPQI